MEHKLSKHQLRMLISLSQQREEAKKTYDDIVEAEQELLAMIIKYAGLPNGEYELRQAGEDIILASKDNFTKEDEKSEE